MLRKRNLVFQTLAGTACANIKRKLFHEIPSRSGTGETEPNPRIEKPASTSELPSQRFSNDGKRSNTRVRDLSYEVLCGVWAARVMFLHVVWWFVVVEEAKRNVTKLRCKNITTTATRKHTESRADLRLVLLGFRSTEA